MCRRGRRVGRKRGMREKGKENAQRDGSRKVRTIRIKGGIRESGKERTKVRK